MLSNVALVAGELENLEDVDENECLACVSSHKDIIVGVKIRLQKQISCDGENEPEAFKLGTFKVAISFPLSNLVIDFLIHPYNVKTFLMLAESSFAVKFVIVCFEVIQNQCRQFLLVNQFCK